MDNRQNNYVCLSKKGLMWPFLATLVLLRFAIPCEAQSGLIPEKYLRITPGVSTRADVEKLYSKSDPKRTFVEYDTPDFSIGIQYSLGPCKLKLGVWGLPEWTVEQVYYNWPEEKRIPLRDIILDRKRFEKRQIGDVVGHDYYVNDEFGIIVVYDQKLKSVVDLGLKLSTKLKEKYTCWKDGK